jgi:hypothetical protein
MAAESNGDWEKIFDGKSLAGWTATDGKPPGKGWKVEDGKLILDGAGGNLISEKGYSSFELEWEWKISAGGNNGIKYWVTAVDGKSWLGIEYQMIDDKRHPDGLRGGSHTTASIYDIKEVAKDKPLKPPGEWNSSRVIVSRICLWRLLLSATWPAKRANPIAGIASANLRVLGLMPHPENQVDPLIDGEDGLPLFESLAAALAAA